MQTAYFDYNSITLTAGAQCKQKGFTLVELLVVITIIAILSVIGITVFTGVQKSARDAKRREDIDAIAKAMEAHYGECAVGKYCNLKVDYFGGGAVPQDPLDGQNKCAKGNNDYCGYCFSVSGAQPGGDPNWANHGCGQPPGVQPNENNYWDNKAQVGSPGGSYYYSTWILCTNTETSFDGKYYYCRRPQQ